MFLISCIKLSSYTSIIPGCSLFEFIDVFFVDNNLLEENSFKVLIDGGLIVLFFNFLFELFSDIISNINVLINF